MRRPAFAEAVVLGGSFCFSISGSIYGSWGRAMTERLNLSRSTMARLGAGALASVALVTAALAASHEQIVEACRQAMMPQLHQCVVGKVGSPRNAPDDLLQRAREQCGAQYVRPCVMREEIRQSAGAPAPAAPKEDAETKQSDVSIALTLQEDGQFAWEVDTKGRKQTLTGTAGFPSRAAA